MTYIDRDIALTINEALKNMPVVIITGMRQTGKSTFLKTDAHFQHRRYVSLDDFAVLTAAKEDPDGFVDIDEPLTIDEAQKCPEILIAVKKKVDKKRVLGQFILSGSANFTILKGVSETLAGRAVYFTMHPFTRRELMEETSQEPFLKKFSARPVLPKPADINAITIEDILTGGMPSVNTDEVENKDIWFKGYEQTYLERDIRELSQIGNIISFRHLLHLAVFRTGQLLSPSQLGRDAKLSAATTSRYLSIMEASFIIYRLPPYLRNPAGRIIKSPKVFISDSGMACYLAGIKNLEQNAQVTLKGAMLETYVAQNLAGIIDARWSDAKLYFWNIQGRHEVDFIIEAGQNCIAIEVKSGSRWTQRDLAGLKAFIASTPHCVAGVLAYNGTQAVKLGDRLWAIPLGMLLM